MNIDWPKRRDSMLPEQLVPIAVVATELNCGTRDIERRCEVIRNEYGIRCIPGPEVLALVHERDAAIEHQRIASARQQAHVAAQLDANAARAKALAQRPRLQGLDDIPMNQAALAEMVALSGDYEAEVAASDARADELWTGTGSYHRIGEE